VSQTPRYPLLPADQPAAALEEQLLARWEAEDLFATAQAARADGPPFTFFEGPPTANGRPGIHHVFARTIKDLVCRHRAMQGHAVPRKAGWDTHGLPVEIEVEKALGISGKQEIERVGVAEFNRRCRESVFTYRGEWEKLSARMAYWLDYARPYVTYSNDYVESVWWALKTLYDKDLLFRGHKILPYCARCGTALSSHEVAQGYEDVEDPSTYVALDLEDHPAGVRRRILVWTTTPWTLVSNTALAVHPDLAYIELHKLGRPEWTLLLAEARCAAVLGEGWEERWTVVQRLRGRDLVGQRYQRPLDWVTFPAEGERHLIVPADFVSADDGSGIVHLAPAFGADDYAAGRQHGLAFVQPVDARGCFDAALPVVGGRFVKEADDLIIAELEQRDVLWKSTRFTHAYPHCWRCRTPLLYYARTSWFVRTTAFKDRMLARNARVDWHPAEIGSGRFGEWLVNNVDWAVSRDRFWGTPLPVWVNDADPDEIEVVGSYAELAAKAGVVLGADFDPHKPGVDAYTWPAPSGRGTMRRVSEVIDTWFDSGSMPFAQWHYPFEHRDTVARQYPGDFIAEGVDQTRGWFYSLLAIATGLGDALPNNGDDQAAPYRAVIVNDLVRDAQGQKMSKSRGNAVDPWAVMAAHGADAVRLFLVASAQVSLPRNFDEQQIREGAGRFLVTLKNTYSGIFAQYANFGWAPSAADPAVADRPAIDRWVLSRLSAVEAEADALLTALDPTAAARAVMAFVTDDVSNWYVRVNRARFYEVDTADSRAAFATLHEVLVVVSRLLAPFAPFISDAIHRGCTGASVHLADYVRAVPTPRDETLEAAMAELRTLARLGRAAREEAGIKVRQPLGRLVGVAVGVPEAALAPLVPLLAAELNVKDIVFAASSDALVTLTAKANFRTLGKKFGKVTNAAAAAVAALPGEQLLALEGGAALPLTVEGVTAALTLEDVLIERRAAGALVVAQDGARFAAIDPTVTEALRAEGLAREFVSRVQRARKDAGLAVSDRIRLVVDGDAEACAAVTAFGEWVAGEVLAQELVVADGVDAPDAQATDLDGLPIRFTLTKVDAR
jgi:isoleucyl-tRNA synthetase